LLFVTTYVQEGWYLLASHISMQRLVAGVAQAINTRIGFNPYAIFDGKLSAYLVFFHSLVACCCCCWLLIVVVVIIIIIIVVVVECCCYGCW
jgi:hypothetical protein